MLMHTARKATFHLKESDSTSTDSFLQSLASKSVNQITENTLSFYGLLKAKNMNLLNVFALLFPVYEISFDNIISFLAESFVII